MSNGKFSTQLFIEAIPGSGGIISTIAKRVGCSWHTAEKYIQEYPTVKQIYDDEREGVLDIAESVLINNIRLALKLQQETNRPVDTADAKWMLSRLAKERGYIERQELTGANGDELIIKVKYDGSNPDTPETSSGAS